MPIARTLANEVWRSEFSGEVSYTDVGSHLDSLIAEPLTATTFVEFVNLEKLENIRLTEPNIADLSAKAGVLHSGYAHSDIIVLTETRQTYGIASRIKQAVLQKQPLVKFRLMRSREDFDCFFNAYYHSSHFRWNESLSIGYQEIDRQHQRLLALTRGLEAEVSIKGISVEIDEELNWHLAELVNYTLDHFGLEQSLLEMHNYPAVVAHGREHLNLSGELLRLQARFQKRPNEVNPAEIFAFFYKWVLRHIQTSDRAAFDWIKTRVPEQIACID